MLVCFSHKDFFPYVFDKANTSNSHWWGGALEWWKEGVSGSSMDSQKVPQTHISWTEICTLQ